MATTADSAAAAAAPAPGAGSAAAPGWPSPVVAWTALVILTAATMMNFFDIAVFLLMAELIKRDYALTDFELGLLLGPAGILFYVIVGIPLARLVDIYRRNVVLGCGLAVTSGMTAAGGLAQSFGQFFGTRMFVGVGGSAHGPGTYSMISDYFPPHKLRWPMAFLQLGFILGTGLGAILGGRALGHVAGWAPTQLGPLTIHNWQWVLLATGAAGLLITCCVFLLPEPPRRGRVSAGKALPIRDVLREIHARRHIYYPLMIGLAVTSLEVGGLQAWRTPFMMRTYGWTPAQIGAWSGVIIFIAFPLGTIMGTVLLGWLGKRHKDAPVRTTATVFALCIPFSFAAPLMPTGELSLLAGALAGVFGFAAAVPQNVAIQTITPNEMRGQVTAVYLFMFTVFGALGASMVPLVTTYIAGGEANLWLSLTLIAALLPVAAWIISLGMRPYAAEIERLEAKGVI